MAAEARDQSKFREFSAQVHMTSNKYRRFGTILAYRFPKRADEKTAEEFLSENKMPLKLQAAFAGSSINNFARNGMYADVYTTYIKLHSVCTWLM